MAVSPNGSGGDGAFFAGDALPGDSADMGGGGGGGGGGNGFVVIRSDEPFKPLGGIIMPDPTELQP
jgi:hypothetical protein